MGRVRPESEAKGVRAFFRYTAVGALSRGIQTGLLFALVQWLGIHYIPASLIAVAIVHAVAFAVHRNWTFKPTVAGGADVWLYSAADRPSGGRPCGLCDRADHPGCGGDSVG